MSQEPQMLAFDNAPPSTAGVTAGTTSLAATAALPARGRPGAPAEALAAAVVRMRQAQNALYAAEQAARGPLPTGTDRAVLAACDELLRARASLSRLLLSAVPRPTGTHASGCLADPARVAADEAIADLRTGALT